MIPGFLHHWREENECPLVLVVKEFLELVSQGLKLELVLHQALKHDALDEIVLVGPGGLGFH